MQRPATEEIINFDVHQLLVGDLLTFNNYPLIVTRDSGKSGYEGTLVIYNEKPYINWCFGLATQGVFKMVLAAKKPPEYQVFDNNKTADTVGYPEMHSSWKNSKFPSFEEAVAYANNWLGMYGPLPENFKIGDKFTYGSEDCSIEIRSL